MTKRFKFVIAIICIALLSGCIFGKGPGPRVMGYRHGTVFLTGKVHYNVGELSKDWKKLKSRARAILFFNREFDASISTSGYCERGDSVRKLDQLAGELASSLKNRRTISEKYLSLDGKDAYSLETRGTLDDAPVYMNVVVVKKGGCSFNFLLIVSDGLSDKVKSDFAQFYGGFSF
ncbi:MAG: hypothetical protein ABIE74_10040 [Pseudomonadota bacterium]